MWWFHKLKVAGVKED